MVRRKYEEETIRLGKDEAKIKSEKRIIRRKGLKEKEDWQNERISRKVRRTLLKKLEIIGLDLTLI